MKPTAWYDPTNGMVSTDKDSPLFTPLGQVWPLFLEEQQITADCPNCEWHKDRAARWRDEAYKQAGHPLPEREWVGLTDKEIEAIWEVSMFANYGVGAELSNQPFVHYARAIEDKLKEKNT